MAVTPDLPLVAREQTLARLASAVEAAAGGGGRVVVLSGEAGAGKSRLVQEVATIAAARGFRVLSSTGSPLQRDLHYAMLIDVLRPLVRRGPRGARTALVEGLPGLAVLFDELGTLGAEPLGDPGLERTRLYESVRRLLARASRQQPVLLLLDDAHWADPASLAAVAYAVAGLEESRVCLVVARRAGEPDHSDAAFLNAVRRLRHCSDVEVGGLDGEGIRSLAKQLLGGEPPQALVEVVAERTGGLPLFVRGIVSQLVAAGRLARVGGHWVMDSQNSVEVPTEVRELLRDRLEALPDDQRRLAELVAIAGGGISHRLLGSAIPTDPLPTLRRLLDSGLLVEDVSGLGVTYRAMHPLLSEVAASLMPEAARRRLHAQLAEVITRDTPMELGLLAHHMTGAGDEVDPAEALEVLRAAVDQALDTQAGAAAARHADAALRLARQLGRDDLVPALLEQRALALDLAGEGTETLEAWSTAARAWHQSGQTREEGRSLVQLSIAEWDRGRFGEALGHIEHAISILRSWPTSDEYLRALATWGGHLHRLSSPRIVEAVAALDRAAQQTGSPIAIQEADIGRAGIAIAGGELATARAYAQKAVAAAEASGRPLLLERALRPLASLELEWGDVHEAVRLTERGMAAARRAGVPTLEVVHRTLRLNVGLYVGEWELVDRGVRELLELAHRTGSGRGVGYALVLQGTLAVYRGDVAAASASRDGIRTVYGGGRQDDRHLFSSVETLTALIDLAQGRPAQAAERLEANLRSLQMMHVVAAQAAAEARIASGQNDLALAQAAMLNPAIAGAAVEAAAEAIAEAPAEGEPEAAGRAAESAVAKAMPSRHGPWADASSHWIRGLVSAARGEADAAAELKTAAESLDRLGLAFPAATAWLDWARVVDDAAAAIDVLTERLSFLDEIGARPLADRARSQLRKLGARPTPARAASASATPGSLSPRELEVAKLVAHGLANTEIAQRLFISPRTVTTHLQHVYERLGISSRTALARWFLEQKADAPAAPVAAEYAGRTMPRRTAQTRPSTP